MQLLPSVRWSGVALGIGIAALMIAPVAIGQQRHLGQPEFERPRELVRELSAKPGDYLQTPFPEIWEFIGWRRERDPSRWSLSPGLWKSGLALAAIGLLWRRPRRRQGWAVCWLGIGLVAAIASFGLHWEIGGCSPYGFLMDWVPGLSRVRVPARFAVVVQIAVVLLSLEFIHEFHRRGRIDWRRAVRAKRPLLKLPLVATWLTALVACFEISQPPMQFVEIPDAQTQQGWLRWLRQTPTDAVIAHVPFPTGTYPSDYQRETWAMYWSLFHQRRIVNGYSGFFPKSYLTLKARMQSFPDSDSLAALRAAGVSYCVIGQAEVEAKQLEADRRFVESFNLAYHDREAGVLIYRWREARTGVDSEP